MYDLKLACSKCGEQFHDVHELNDVNGVVICDKCLGNKK
jgi:formylmethanofuran dehydrogenase subunit E